VKVHMEGPLQIVQIPKSEVKTQQLSLEKQFLRPSQWQLELSLESGQCGLKLVTV
jgi:hypothetical protein